MGQFSTTLLAAWTAACLAGTAAATPIAPGAFGAGAVAEDFEGQTAGANVGNVTLMGVHVNSLLAPALVGNLALPSGAAELGGPNPGVDNGGAFLHDFALGNDVTNNWGGFRLVNDAGDVPSGSSYIGATHPSGGTVSIEFDFAADQDRVGAYVTGFVLTNVTLDVYDASIALLESLSVATVDLASWGSNFLGIENLAGIRRAVFSGTDFGLDLMTSEAAAPLAAPEPATALPVGGGLAGLAGLAVMGRRNPARERARRL